MRYRDTLYGEWELPKILSQLVHTKEAERMRGITMTVLPNELNPVGAFPSRADHGLGVAYLMTRVIEHNPHLDDRLKTLLPIAAFLHDAGNAPFAHLSENFLRETTGCDGESFLARILVGSETEKILVSHGFSVDDVVRVVTGNMKPFSDVLNGSLDVDNLDNILRYNYSGHIGTVDYNAPRIASAFRFINNEWTLLREVWDNTIEWQEARKIVYSRGVYSALHLQAAMMMHRAVEFAFFAGNLSEEFFRMTDHDAVEFLKNSAHVRTQELITRMGRWDFYNLIFDCADSRPSEGMKLYASDWRGRSRLADRIAMEFCLLPEHVYTYTGKGRDFRKINIPFVGPCEHCGTRIYNQIHEDPVYRIMVFLAPESEKYRHDIISFIQKQISR